MNWGIFFYIILYRPSRNTVSINCIDSRCGDNCRTYEYTKGELITYSQWYRGINPLYEEALKHFPKEKTYERI